MKINFILFSLFVLPVASYGNTVIEPTLINSNEVKKVEFGVSIEKALKEKNLSFEPLSIDEYNDEVKKMFTDRTNQLPMAITGDYNGDGQKDLVILGKSKQDYIQLAFLSEGSKYTLLTIDKWNKKLFRSIFGKKGEIDRFFFGVKKSTLKFKDKKKRDVFQFQIPKGPAQLFYFDGKKFVYLKAGDPFLELVK